MRERIHWLHSSVLSSSSSARKWWRYIQDVVISILLYVCTKLAKKTKCEHITCHVIQQGNWRGTYAAEQARHTESCAKHIALDFTDYGGTPRVLDSCCNSYEASTWEFHKGKSWSYRAFTDLPLPQQWTDPNSFNKAIKTVDELTRHFILLRWCNMMNQSKHTHHPSVISFVTRVGRCFSITFWSNRFSVPFIQIHCCSIIFQSPKQFILFTRFLSFQCFLGAGDASLFGCKAILTMIVLV